MQTVDELNTVATSVETWRDFIDASMGTEFYRLARRQTRALEMAAAFTLLRNYISIFPPEEQQAMLQDVEFFYKRAKNFIIELAPYRYNKEGYNDEVRAAFIGKIRTLLRETRNPDGEVRDRERYIFIRTLVKFCSSLGYIIKIYDAYKEFLFRDLPQLRNVKA